jgi:hypothetical protein
VLISLPAEDMYALNEPTWRFLFGWKSNRSGVVSTARFISFRTGGVTPGSWNEAAR